MGYAERYAAIGVGAVVSSKSREQSPPRHEMLDHARALEDPPLDVDSSSVQKDDDVVGRATGEHHDYDAPHDIPPCLLDASACRTEVELRAWRITKLTWIRDHAPEAQWSREASEVDKEFASRQKELVKEMADRPKPPGAAALVAAAAQASSPAAETERFGATVLFVLTGLLLPALLVALGRCACTIRRLRGKCSGDVDDQYAMWNQEFDVEA